MDDCDDDGTQGAPDPAGESAPNTATDGAPVAAASASAAPASAPREGTGAQQPHLQPRRWRADESSALEDSLEAQAEPAVAEPEESESTAEPAPALEEPEPALEPAAAASRGHYPDLHGWWWEAANLHQMAALPPVAAVKGSLPSEERDDAYVDSYISRKALAGEPASLSNLLFVITRSKVNHSALGYFANRSTGGGVDHKNPMDAKWIDIDHDKLPSQRGKPSDLVPIDFFGRRAYWFDCKTASPSQDRHAAGSHAGSGSIASSCDTGIEVVFRGECVRVGSPNTCSLAVAGAGPLSTPFLSNVLMM